MSSLNQIKKQNELAATEKYTKLAKAFNTSEKTPKKRTSLFPRDAEAEVKFGKES